MEYSYDIGGKLSAVQGQRDGQGFAYVDQIGYDEQERMSFICFGNSVETTYAYNPERQWLDTAESVRGGRCFNR